MLLSGLLSLTVKKVKPLRNEIRPNLWESQKLTIFLKYCINTLILISNAHLEKALLSSSPLKEMKIRKVKEAKNVQNRECHLKINHPML